MKRFTLKMSLLTAVVAAGVPTFAEVSERMAQRADTPAGISAATQRTGSEAVAVAGKNKFREVPAANSRAPRKATAMQAGDMPVIYGTVTQSSYGSATYNAPGVYELPTAEGTEFELVAGDINAKYGATLVGNYLYVPEQEEVDFFGIFYSISKYDVTDGFAYSSGGSVSNDHFKTRCSAPDPTEPGVAYGCCYNGDRGYNFSKIDYAAKSETAIKAISTQWQVCGINASGELYAIDSSKKLYQVDKSTGEQTLVATLEGITLSGMNSGVFDLKTGLMYLSTSSSWSGAKGGLYALDVDSGELTLIHEYAGGETVTSMFIPVDDTAADAPAAPSGLSASFPGGSLSGTVSFTMPSTYYDGTAASGAFHYSVAVDGVEKANGVEVAGAQVDCPVTVDAEGQHKIEVHAFNANGNSPKVKTQLYIGKDAPLAVSNVQATYADGTIRITWDAATGSVNGGFVDPEETTYTITRRPDGAVIGSGIKATEFATQYSVPEGELVSFTFEVTASYDGRDSEAAVSNAVVLGNVVPPCEWTFTSKNDMAGMTIVDANADGKTWTQDTYSGYLSVSYNSKLAMDDWLFLPPMRLQGGYSYQLRFETKASSARYSEHLEVMMGGSATAEAMEQTLVERFEIAESDFTAHQTKFTAPADGLYYIGFHGCSDKDRNRLYLKNISVSAGAAPVAPGAVGNLTVVADAAGYNKVEISFEAPSVNVDGSELAACDIEVRRDGETIKTISGAAAGSAQSIADEPERGGTYTYTVVPSVAGVEGEVASATVFVGLKAPQPVENVAVDETANDGEVLLTWDAPALDAEGNAFNSALVRYNVYWLDGVSGWQLVAEEISECSLTHRINDGTEQALAVYAVEAVTDGGAAALVASETLAVGKAYELPYADSFGDVNDYIYGTRSIKGSNQWMTLDDVVVDMIESVDADNAFLAVQQSGAQACGEFFTGKISLAGMEEPVLSFYTFNTIDAAGQYPDMNTIEVRVRAAGAWHPVQTAVVAETGPANRWNKVFVPLGAYAGQNVQIALRVTCNTFLLTAIDALRIDAETDNNMAVGAFEVPGEVFAGADTHFDIVVENRGMKPAAGYDVELWLDGELLDKTTAAAALDAGQKARHSFVHRFAEAGGDAHTAEARVVLAGDAVAEDNAMKAEGIVVDESVLPAATGLTATVEDGRVVLGWSAPDMSTARPDATTEGFEGYEAFDRNPSGWTMVDVDKAAIGGIKNITLPGVAAGSQQSFWVSEASEAVFGDAVNTFVGHNSLKYLMQMYVTDTDGEGKTVACDDWAISPELFGCKQTVGLWARSYMAQLPESFEILWSDGSLDPADFTVAAAFSAIPAYWSHYSVQLPEGARRMAVRCVSRDKFSLLVDDITFIASEGTTSLKLLGYDVYCDGEQAGESAGTSFEAPLPESDGLHEYAVVARYDRGTAPQSNVATVQYSGIADVERGAVKVTAGLGCITVEGAEGMSVGVFTPAGVSVSATGSAPALMKVEVPCGIYLVSVGSEVHKVAVR